MKINEVLLLKRRSIKMTQQQLSDKSGVAISTIRSIEGLKYEPRWGTVQDLCKVLGITELKISDD